MFPTGVRPGGHCHRLLLLDWLSKERRRELEGLVDCVLRNAVVRDLEEPVPGCCCPELGVDLVTALIEVREIDAGDGAVDFDPDTSEEAFAIEFEVGAG